MNKIPKINLVAVLIMIVCIVLIIKRTWVPEVKQIVSEGVIATVDNVQNVSDNKWSIEISLSKEDGTAFDDNLEVGNISLSSSNTGSFGFENEREISSDRKVISYHLTVQSNTNINRMEIELDNLVIATQATKVLDKSIYDIYNTHPLEYDYEQEIIEAKSDANIVVKEDGLIPISDIDNFHIIGVGFSNNYDASSPNGQVKQEVLHIRTKLSTPTSGVSNVARISGLYNELNEEKINYFQGYSRPVTNPRDKGKEPNEDIDIEEDYYELTNTEKLKHIKPIVDYTLKEVINDGKWILNVKF